MTTKPAPRLILGSASPRRLDLLQQIEVKPDATDPADIDETPRPRELPRAYALRLATEKAEVVAARHPHSLVLTADTVVSSGRRILDKTDDPEEARRMLEVLSGRRHRVTTGVCLIRTSDGKTWTRIVESVVRFKRLSTPETLAYIDSGEWRGKAGAYAIQGRAAMLIPWMSGSYSNIVGLPLAETAGILRAAGYPL